MADYSRDFPVMDNEPMPKEPLAHAQSLVLQHAAQLKKLLDNMEEQIAIIGQQLDNYTKARDVLTTALLCTDKLRVDIQPAEPGSLNPGRF